MGAARGLGSGCSKRSWQWVQREGLVVAGARAFSSEYSTRAW